MIPPPLLPCLTNVLFDYKPMSKNRDPNTKGYKAFVKAVKRRDGNRCRFPGCTSRTKIEVHHIVPLSQRPDLAESVENGLSLCASHHKLVNGKELEYIDILKACIPDDPVVDAKLAMLMRRPRV